MRLTEAINALETLYEAYGDLPIGGGSISEDKSPSRFTPLNKNGEEDWISPVEIFIE